MGKVWKQGLNNLHLLHVDAPPHSLQDGQQDGIGVTHYADGASYDGFWRQGQKHGVGLYRPSPTAAAQPPGIVRGGRLRLAVSRQLPAPPGAAAVGGDASGSVGWGAAETSFVEPLPLPGMHSGGHFTPPLPATTRLTTTSSFAATPPPPPLPLPATHSPATLH